MTTIHKTRESWLNKAVEHLTHLYAQTSEHGEPVRVPSVVVGVGFPLTGGRKSRGVCWPTKAAADGVSQIYMSPALGNDDVQQILVTLIHELAHAIDDCESGHTGRFRKLVEQMGLVAPFTSATANEGLIELLKPILDDLGEYPHAKLDIGMSKKKPQVNRQIKAECKAIVDEADVADHEAYANRLGETCGYKVRASQTMYDIAVPDCPVHDVQLEVEKKKEAKTP